jgi:predicted acylesterase/phospholipase RssA
MDAARERMTYRIPTRDEHFSGGGPKRILALDGGGLRGILTLGILAQIEDTLRQRHQAGDGFRLAHYFDLMAGTSTGAIIAAALALGWSVRDVAAKYLELGSRVFRRTWLRQGLVRARYDEGELIRELQAVYGAGTTLGSDALQTGLLVMVKRLDSGSPWPVSNNPRGTYFASRPGGIVGNGDYLLWQAVRASTAAPDYFDPERITVAQRPNHTPIEGDFVDGGVSPFNNPALQAFMYATLSGYRVGWPAGKDRILLVSLGTGMADPAVRRSNIAAAHAFRSLLSLMDDCASLQELVLQWMSQSPTARAIDREVGRLDGDVLGGSPLLSYVRYDADLRPASVHALLGDGAAAVPIENLSAMDAPENMDALHRIGVAVGQRDVAGEHFPPAFDLPADPERRAAAPAHAARARYLRRPDRPLVAIQLRLDTDGLVYRKWGAVQRAKPGDWLVENDRGDLYTVDADVFARTYRQLGTGTYLKVTPVWAERAAGSGSVTTKEGETRYAPGDYLVSNAPDGSDAYAMTAATFEALYEPAPSDDRSG